MRRPLLIGLFILIAAALGWLFSKPARWAVYHEPSAVDLMAPLAAQDFDAYISASRDMIRQATAQLEAPPDETMIARRLPFELKPDPATCPSGAAGRAQRGALLVHGLSDSPWLVRDISAALRANCYLVRAVLLPGHGTLPGDFSRAGPGEWMAAVEFGIASFEDALDGPLVLVGYSAGASLAILFALENGGAQSPQIAAIVGFAPALHGPSEAGDLRPALLRLLWRTPRFRYFTVRRQRDPVKYESFAARASLGYREIQERIGDLRNGKPLRVPFFGAISDVDMTVPAENVVRFFCQRVTARRYFALYTNDDELVPPCPDIYPRPAAFPEEGVLEITHIGITNRVSNPVYGPHPGAYVNCHHYLEEGGARYATCLETGKTPRNSAIRYAEPRPENLEAHLIRRGMFNPDFDGLMELVISWLDRVVPAVGEIHGN